MLDRLFNRAGAHVNCIVQSQTAVTAYFSNEQLLPFGFAEQNSGDYCEGHRHYPKLMDDQVTLNPCNAEIFLYRPIFQLEIIINV